MTATRAERTAATQVALDALEQDRDAEAIRTLAQIGMDAADIERWIRHPPRAYAKVGDILYSSWGYDQTNIDWYVVVAVSPSGKTVTLREVAGTCIDEPGPTDARASTHDTMVPVAAHIVPDKKPLRRRISPTDYGYSVSIESYAGAWLWDGRPRSQTGFGYGH